MSCRRSEELRHALEEPVQQIIDAIKTTLDKTRYRNNSRL